MRFLILPLLLYTSIGWAQVTMDEFLFSVLETPAIQAFDNQNVFLESNPYRLSVIRRMEFRTESNQLDPERQDFALRLNPANPWELKRNNQYFQTYQEVLQLDRERELKKLLKERYDAIINWVYLEEIKKLKEEEQTITQNLIRMLEAQRFSNYFNANDYVELKIDQVEKIVELEEHYFNEDNQRSQIETLFPPAKNQSLSWTFDALISIDALEKQLDGAQEGSIGEVAYREKRINLAQAEWALEKSNINVGFLQAQYQQFRVEQDRSPWSIGLGVTLPFFNPNKGDMAKRKLELMEAEGDLADAKNEQQAGMELMKTKVKTLTNRHTRLQNQMDSLNMDALASTLQEIKGSNPVVVMRLKRSLVKLKNSTARLRKEIYLAYVEYLWYAEMLQQQPLKNYLEAVN